MNLVGMVHLLAALLLCPLLLGVINRTKAFFAGRSGQPLLQLYFDLHKLLQKGTVYSTTASWVVKAGPMVGLACAATALMLVPFAGMAALLGFQGDLLLFAYLLGLMRFFTVIAALDTGSSFEGMGASREVTFSMLAEPALLLGLAAMARFVSAGASTAALSLSGIYGPLSTHMLVSLGGPAMLLVAAALGIVFLAENSRIPVDDPNTHLELTMIHEVMVLDHGGVDLAFIQYGAALKLWLLGSLLVGIVLPVRSGLAVLDLAAGIGGMFILAVLVGVIESTMARLRLLRVPQLLVAATVLSVLAMILVTR